MNDKEIKMQLSIQPHDIFNNASTTDATYINSELKLTTADYICVIACKSCLPSFKVWWASIALVSFPV